jgi:uncharacterized protein (DUF2252 family)
MAGGAPLNATVAERAAQGKGARAIAPRSSFGSWNPAPGRADPVAILEEQAATRVAELVPLRYGRMSASAFAFLRGSAAVMAHDLSRLPRTGLTVQLCGDAHLANFGMFAAPDRRQVFGINDFDETLPGPFEWDVARLVASFAVACRTRGFDEETRTTVVMACVHAYHEEMQRLSERGWLETWYARLDVDELTAQFALDAGRRRQQRLSRSLEKSRSKDRLAAFAKLTTVVDGEARFVSTPPLLVPIEELVPGMEAERINDVIHGVLRAYRRSLQSDRRWLLERYRYVHLARKVVGVGSVGTRAWVLLLVGRDEQDPLLLQVKEAQRSVLEPYLGRPTTTNHGQRVVHGQRMMQAASDILLGWHRTSGLDGVDRDFYVRQLWDSKGSADIERMVPAGVLWYAGLCGRTLALAHARSGDAVAIAAYLGSGDAFERSMAVFAEAYADQTEADHARLGDAVAAGRVAADVEAA